jgi:hypothetical protein
MLLQSALKCLLLCYMILCLENEPERAPSTSPEGPEFRIRVSSQQSVISTALGPASPDNYRIESK